MCPPGGLTCPPGPASAPLQAYYSQAGGLPPRWRFARRRAGLRPANDESPRFCKDEKARTAQSSAPLQQERNRRWSILVSHPILALKRRKRNSKVTAKFLHLRHDGHKSFQIISARPNFREKGRLIAYIFLILRLAWKTAGFHHTGRLPTTPYYIVGKRRTAAPDEARRCRPSQTALHTNFCCAKHTSATGGGFTHNTITTQPCQKSIV